MKKVLLFALLCLWVVFGQAKNILKITHLNHDDMFMPFDITCAVEDGDGFVWLGSRSGLLRYDGVNFEYYQVRIKGDSIFMTNSIDRIWLNDDGKLLCKCLNRYTIFDNKTHEFTPYDIKETPKLPRYRPDSTLTALVGSMEEYRNEGFFILLKDKQGGIWVRTEMRLDRIVSVQEPVSPSPVNPDGREVIRALFTDKQNNIWVADKNGVVRIVNEECKTKGFLTPDGRISPTYSVFGAAVYAMVQDHYGDLWMGTKNQGVYRLKRTNTNRFEVEHLLMPENPYGNRAAQQVYALEEDKYNRMWVGTYGDGLRMIDISKRDDIKVMEDLKVMILLPKQAFTVRRLMIRPDQVMLIATNAGLYVTKVEQQVDKMKLFSSLPIEDDSQSLLNSRVMDMTTDSRGRIFLATYGGGVSQIVSENLLTDNLRMKNYTVQDGLPMDICLGIQAGNDGRIWVVTEAGVSILSPDMEVSPSMPHAHTLRCENYSIRSFNGVHRMEEVHPQCFPSGRIIAGTNKGPLSFSPEDVRKSSYAPNIVFDSPSHIELSPDEHSVMVHFSSIDLNCNGRAQYAYKIDGINDDWIYTREPRIAYSNLPAGDFVLRVRSTNSDGVWTDNERQITIHRTPHFNERPMAWMLYGILITILVFIALSVYRYTRKLQGEISTIRLSSREKIEYLEARLYDTLHVSKLNRWDANNTPEEAENDVNKAFKDKIIAFIQSRIGDSDLSVQDIAQEMCVSRSLLYLQTKQIMGSTPNNLVLEQRIAYAVSLINNHESNISDIAYKCGFSDPKYFTRCFKKATGMSPSDYRKIKKSKQLTNNFLEISSVSTLGFEPRTPTMSR